MSYKAMDWVEAVRGIHPVERIVLLVLAKRANTQNQCWPSIATITEAADVGRRSVFRALEKLQDMGLLQVSARQSEGGRSRSNMYTLNLHRLGPKHKHECHSGTVEGVMVAPIGCQGGTLIGIDVLVSESSDGKSEASGADADFSFLTKPSESKMKAADFMKAMENSMTEQVALDKAGPHPSSHRLAILWKDLHGVHKIGVYVAPLTTKEAGQLSHLAKSLVGCDLPRVMSAVIRDWVGFGKFCKEQGVVTDFPDNPHIGFFLKHGTLADQFRQKAILSSVKGGSKMMMLD